MPLRSSRGAGDDGEAVQAALQATAKLLIQEQQLLHQLEKAASPLPGARRLHDGIRRRLREGERDLRDLKATQRKLGRAASDLKSVRVR